MFGGMKSDDHRRQKRFQAEEGVFVAPAAQSRKLWQILDISVGGLSFRYIPAAQEITRSSELEIVTRDTIFSLGNIPYRSISECEIAQEGFSEYTLRRHSVQFGDLTGEQMSKLHYCIQNHTVAELRTRFTSPGI